MKVLKFATGHEVGELSRTAMTNDPVTIERLERALAVCAYVVSVDGEKALPIFERLERELDALVGREAAVDRAKRLLASLGGPAAIPAIAPPGQSDR